MTDSELELSIPADSSAAVSAAAAEPAPMPEPAAAEAAPEATQAESPEDHQARDEHDDHHDDDLHDEHDEGHDEAAQDAAQSAGGAAKAPAGKSGHGGGHDARSVGFIALPVNTSQLIKKYGVTHPGLVLNKYAVLLRLQDRRLQYDFSAEQKKRILQKVAHLLATTDALRQQWSQAHENRNRVFGFEGARRVSLTSSSPLAFVVYHPFAELGVELHPIYGFPLLPSAHIKGALRKFALEQWLPEQADAAAARQQIDTLFGLPNRPERPGEVIFHDAWPDAWPALSVELYANHHAPYYHRHEAAGDWQAPQADYFLAIKPGSRFAFAFSKRSPALADSELELVESWLQGLLQHQGLGAYRQQGFGQWKPASGEVEAPASAWSTTLSLASPAFLAGATFRPEDCRLRSGTVRGLLRWWWRTMHAGFLPHRELLQLESLVWGSPSRKGAIGLSLEPTHNAQARRYRPEDILRQLPGPEGEKRSPGLVYLGYGLFAESAKRYYLGTEARWSLQLNARSASWQRKEGAIEIPAELLMQQAQAALWLLCHYGGVGQRKRKGFGGLGELTGLALSEDKCLELGTEFRRHCQVHGEFADDKAESPALMQRIELADIATPWKNPWFALHQLGESLQTFMQQHKHEAVKQGLGLPRPMDPPVNGEFTAAAPVKNRHAAPFFLHLVPGDEGRLAIRVVAFPAAKLPSLAESQQLLTELTHHLRGDLSARAEKWAQEPTIDLSAPPPPVRGRGGKREPVAAAAGARSTGGWKPRPPGWKPEPKPEGEEATADKPRRRPDERGPRPERGERGPRPARGERPDRGERKDRGDRAPRGDRPPREGGFERKGREGFDRKGAPGGKPVARSGPRAPQAGDWVDAVLLEERTKKGGWRAEHAGSKLSGPLVNTGHVPGEQSPGDKVELIIHSLNKFEMMFRWPSEAERAKKDKQKK